MTSDSSARETVTRAFRVAYDGREYAGFQRQPHAHTVSDALLDALAEHGVVERGDGPTHATPPGYAAAGRTDAGVSAVAQTVAFEAPTWLTPRAFNGHLPGSVRVWAAADVGEGFHATHDAVRRTYRYHLYAPAAGNGDDDSDADGDGSDATHERPRDPEHAVDDDRFRDALARFDGEHDFHNLTTDETGTVRDLDAQATRDGDVIVVELAAGGFPRSLVRRVVAAVRAVSRGTADLAWIDRLLADEPVAGGRGVGPAPAEPLVLWDVTYPEAEFTVDREALESACVAFGERHRDARHAAAATGAVRERLATVGERESSSGRGAARRRLHPVDADQEGVAVDVRRVHHAREPQPGRGRRPDGDVIARVEGTDRTADHEFGAAQFGVRDARQVDLRDRDVLDGGSLALDGGRRGVLQPLDAEYVVRAVGRDVAAVGTGDPLDETERSEASHPVANRPRVAVDGVGYLASLYRRVPPLGEVHERGEHAILAGTQLNVRHGYIDRSLDNKCLYITTLYA
ncbi:tRNA pseudouridine synthase A [Halorubrum sp. DM2]|nr:tRNA pseudouridine synthase A [Halorubrum sp. DM2]